VPVNAAGALVTLPVNAAGALVNLPVNAAGALVILPVGADVRRDRSGVPRLRSDRPRGWAGP
jgi:hypothetical protein